MSEREEGEVDEWLGKVDEVSDELAPDEEGGEDFTPAFGGIANSTRAL